MSSIGVISPPRTACACFKVPPAESTRSVRRRRMTVGPTLPSATLTSGPRTPAHMTFEIACARRVPTLRQDLLALDSWNFHGYHELVRPAHGRTIARIETNKGHDPFLVGRAKHDGRISGCKYRQRISRGRRVGDVTTQCAAILDLPAANLARGRDEHRQSFADQRRGDDLRIGRQRADSQRFLTSADATEFLQRP